MKKSASFLFSFLFLLLALMQCSPTPKAGQGEMLVSGKIEGLRKGTLYLQKFVDTLLTSIDSVSIDGMPQFAFTTPIESPELYYLSLTKDDGDSLKDRIPFFGEPGSITINTRLKTFETSAQIKGSENQNLPGYIVLTAGRGSSGGATLWQNGFLPSNYAGVQFRNGNSPLLNLTNPRGLPVELQRSGLETSLKNSNNTLRNKFPG